MNANPNADKVPLIHALQDLIAEHGTLATLVTLLRASRLRKAQMRGQLSDRALTNHLRRDIGLRQLPEAPALWEHYR